MENQRLDLGVVTALQAEVFGEPGSRTFRLFAETSEGRVSLWLEKEQVVMLGTAVDELLARIPDELGNTPTSETLRSFVGELEVKAGELTIGYDADHAGFSVEAGGFDSPFDITEIGFLASREQFVGISGQIGEIVSAGRPRCPLCGRVITGGTHFCPESNGHAHMGGPE